MLDINFKLSDGRIIMLSSLYTSSSYENLLEGEVTSGMTERALHSKKAIAEKLWPNEPVLVLNGDNDSKLPEVAFVAKFISPDSSRDPNKMASSLILIWFGSSVEINREGIDLDPLSWNECARDFNW